ncbi:adenylyltransferase/cytidyltransferase family protein [Limnoglobus roseus]|uniref:D-glycero-beta-D-manno-heptose 1-phosphate adenylyltransferase n=1 Tax=Limnoglobus roseus TaxID=2598579 RepID=A0A5C1AAX9_9BACT|nr:adenylyltransferase/cytidyltransferase family protein [Limnoglobus roseus]QEL16539.1 D-glycero-beta-D-manno-heptose 1-phosphate adenylyltransferase [Limnoglobus roseus]
MGKRNTIVFTSGCFDILHVGHLSTLEFAKAQGDILIVGMNSDESVSRLKPGRPVNKRPDRVKILMALEIVNCVIIFDQDTPLELIKIMKPDVIVKGGDYEAKDVVGYGLAEVRIAPYLPGYSTTRILEAINGQS